jgi:hypothetical protein
MKKWSRFSGGSGAPLWTLQLAGLVPHNFTATGAAIVHNTHSEPANFPKMIWPTNYTKLATATMFTLFFGGRTFAPHCMVPTPEGALNIQDYLQKHYMDSFVYLATRISKEYGLLDDVVVGYDTLNEPHHGFIGISDLRSIPAKVDLKNGYMPTPFQSMILGNGTSQSVQFWEMTWSGPRFIENRTIQPNGKKAWVSSPEEAFGPVKAANVGCIWANHGVWDPTTTTCLRPEYFSVEPETGREIDFLIDFWKPFIVKFVDKMTHIHKEAIIFVEPPVTDPAPYMQADLTHKRLCYAPHWYDGLTLINKKFNSMFTVDVVGLQRGNYVSPVFALKFGEQGIKSCFSSQLATLKEEGQEYLGDFPCIMGEIGIPFDLDDKNAYSTGDYSSQIKAMNANMVALESNYLNFTLWNYCPDNSNAWGDGWNGEDLSIFSRVVPKKKQEKQQDTDSKLSESTQVTNSPRDSKEKMSDPQFSLDLGGRALEAFVRPYPLFLPGTPLKFRYSMKETVMTLVYRHLSHNDPPPTSFVCEIFLPNLHFSSEKQLELWASDSLGIWTLDIPNQRLYWKCSCTTHDPNTTHTLIMRRSGPNQKAFEDLILEKQRPNYDEVERVYACPSCTIS